jgi:hypothetical protein
MGHPAIPMMRETAPGSENPSHLFWIKLYARSGNVFWIPPWDAM